MKAELKAVDTHRVAHGRGQVLLVGLFTLLLLAWGSRWVSAHNGGGNSSGDNMGFVSPLGTPLHAHDELHELLATIIDREALTAETLGISVEELQAARESGVKLDELIAQLGLDEATVYTALQTATTVAVEQAVSDGLLTAEQAAALLNPPAPRDHNPGQPPAPHGEQATTSGGTIPATTSASVSESNGTIPAVAATPNPTPAGNGDQQRPPRGGAGAVPDHRPSGNGGPNQRPGR